MVVEAGGPGMCGKDESQPVDMLSLIYLFLNKAHSCKGSC